MKGLEHVRRTIRMVSLCTLLLLALVSPALAANRVEQIDIEAVLQQDGSLTVLQTWEGTFSEGTELYIPLHVPGDERLLDFGVADETGAFETIQQWDVNASLAQKTQKCGVLQTKDGYELCFGIGAYGTRSFSIAYTLGNVISAYSDVDGASFCFVNQDMNTTPTQVTLELRLADGTPITEENCKVWGFGFDGSTQIEDGTIRMSSKEPIQQNNYVTLMLALSKGVVSPERVQEGSFDRVKAQAFPSAGVESDTKAFPWAIVLGSSAVGVLAILCFIVLRRRKRENVEKPVELLAKEHAYYQDLPNEGERLATYVLGELFQLCEEGDILKMGLLRLLNLGCIETVVEEQTGFLGRAKGKLGIQLRNKPGEGADTWDQELYSILDGLAGPEGMLAEDASIASEEYVRKMQAYLEDCEEKGRKYLTEKRCFSGYEVKGNLKYLSEDGKKELKEILGFRQYLQDFSSITEREEAQERALWKDYFGYAILFGVTKPLLQQMKKVHPELESEVESYHSSLSLAETFTPILLAGVR